MELPREIFEEVSKDQPRLNAVPLLSVDDKGFPHVAMLSYWELFLHGEDLYFFLNSFSRSTKYLRRRQECCLAFFQREFIYYVKGRAQWLADLQSRSIFLHRIESVLEDNPMPEEEDVSVESGIRFEADELEIARRQALRKRMSEHVERAH